MKFVVSIFLIALLALTACLYLPWWSIAIAAFIVTTVIPQRPGKAFLAGFIALFLLWGTLSLYISSRNDHLLAHRLSQLFFKMDSPALIICVTALMGALVAGLGALCGSFLRRVN